MSLTPHPRQATVAWLTIACGGVIGSLLGCNLAMPTSQPNTVVVDASTAELRITPEATAPEVPTSTPASTATAPYPPEASVNQAAQTVADALMLPPTPLAPLVEPGYPLLSRAVEVPLRMRIPALNLRAPVLGVGLTGDNAMAAPVGVRADDPIWWSVFWYRGGDVPGEVGTATFAGHFDDDLGRPAIFAFLAELEVGDAIFIDDQRNGAEIPFVVTETVTYTRQESTDPAILARIFGADSVGGAQATPDVVSRLTLIACDGAWINGSFDQHLVVYATRASYPLG